MSQPGRGTGRLTSIGPYTLLDRVGSGGMGVVYRALDRRSGTVVAFKLLHEHVAADLGAVERFRREAHVASLLRSSYVVRTLEFGSEDGKYYLVSEFIEGRTLADVLKDGTPEPLAAIAIVSQAALALDEAYSREVTHRDIKPENIMVTDDGSVRLGDFGIASMSYLGGLTQAGSYVGTVAYSAPEQHHGQSDIRSDIYSLGVVLFEMLAGRRPFEGSTAPEVMRLHESEPVPVELLANLPPALVSVVSRCLEKDSARRYQRPSELLAALDHARPAVAGAVGDSWMESAVASLAATGAHPFAEPASSPDVTAAVPGPAASAPLAAATAVDAPAAGPRAAAAPEPAATRVEPVPTASGAGGGRLSKNLLIAAGAGGIALIAGVAAVFALAGGGDDEDPPGGSGNGDATTVVPGATTAAPTSATVSATDTPPAGETPDPGKSPTQAGGGPTFAPAPPTQGGGAPTATPRPPTNTPVPPTATTAPQPAFSSPVFATTLTDSGLPPAGGVASGGTISGACPASIWAYVTHTNVPVGTQMAGTWTFQGNSTTNPTFGTNAVNGGTNYQFSRNPSLLPGLYSFVLRAGGSLVTQGTVTVAC